MLGKRSAHRLYPKDIHWEFMDRKHADYEVVRVEEDRVFIVDLDLGNISVTNDAEYVYQEIQEHFPNKRVIYRDTMNHWDEINMDRNNIIRSTIIPILTFQPYTDYTPDPSEITKHPSSEFLRNKFK